jgi:hypothetical protein
MNNDNIYYVYEWIRLDTNEPFYVGKGKNGRWRDCKRGNNKHFNNLVNSIPVAVCMLHENLTEKEALDYECWYIDYYKYQIGYDIVNICDGGEGVIGYVFTEDVKEKLRGIHAGDKNPSARSVILLNTKEVFTTVKQAEETYKIKGISSCCRGITYSSGRDNNGISLLWEYYDENKIYTESDFVEKLNFVNKTKFESHSRIKKGIIPKNSREVILLNTGEIFKSVAEAKRKYNLGALSQCCSEKTKYCGKTKDGIHMIWRYYDKNIEYTKEYFEKALEFASNAKKGKNSFMFGRHLSEETKRKMLESRKNNKTHTKNFIIKESVTTTRTPPINL